jgi:hypothetical protein
MVGVQQPTLRKYNWEPVVGLNPQNDQCYAMEKLLISASIICLCRMR